MKKLFTIILLICIKFSYSQILQFNWAHDTIGSSVQLMKRDTANNLYIIYSNIQNTTDFDPSPLTYTLDNSVGTWALVKYSTSGALIWAKNFGNTNLVINDFEVSNVGNIFLTGTIGGGYNTTSTVDINPSATAVYSLTNNSGKDVFVAKFNSTCNFIWAFSFGNSQTYSYQHWDGTWSYYGLDCSPNGLSIDSFENVFIGGYITGSNNDCDPSSGIVNLSSTATNYSSNGFYAKYNSAGGYVNSYVYSTTNTGTYPFGSVNDLVIDNNNDLIVSMNVFQATIDVDQGVAVNTYGSNTSAINCLVKYSNTGAYIWSYSNQNPSYSPSFQKLKINNNNDIFVGGDGNGTNYNLTGTPTYTFNGIPIIKYNSNCVYQYGFVPNNNSQGFKDYDISNNDIYVIGTFNGVVDFDPSATNYTLSPVGDYDGFISKYSSGNFVYTHQFGNTSTYSWISSSLNKIVLASNNIYVQGNTVPNADIDFSATNSYTFSSMSANFIAKYYDCTVPSAPIDITPISNKTICATASTTLSASASGSINWYNSIGASTPISTNSILITPSLSAGSYTYYAEAYTCINSGSRTSITFMVNSLPSIITSTLGPICNTETVNINASGANTYIWSTGANTYSIVTTPSITTSYTVVGMDINNCANTATVSVTVNPIPTMSISSTSSLICVGETATLSVSGANTYTWSTTQNVLSISVSPSVTTTYTVNGTDNNGCENFAVISQSVSACLGIETLASSASDYIYVYPNPCNGNFTIETEQETSIFITNTLGEIILTQILQQGVNTINISSQACGMYFIKYENSNFKIIKR